MRARTDVRRLPLASQIAAVRRYADARARSAHGSGGMQDPFVYPEDIARRFRCICPAGLWQAWVKDEERRAAAREAKKRDEIVMELRVTPGGWAPLQGHSLARLREMQAEGLIERRRNPHPNGPRHLWRLVTHPHPEAS